MNKQERKEKYNQIREMYEPIGKAKDYAMKQMIKTGKRMGRMRYLMLAVLFLFLFTYHFSFAIFTQLKMREKMARALALAMSVIFAFTSVDVTVFAAAKLQEQKEEQNEAQKEGQDSVLIVGLEDLEENVRHQTLPLGATETDIVFPATLSASVLKSDTEQLETEEPVPEEVEEQPEAGDEEELGTGEGEEEPGTGAGGEKSGREAFRGETTRGETGMKVIYVDDEKILLENFRLTVEGFPEIESLETFGKSEQAIACLWEGKNPSDSIYWTTMYRLRELLAKEGIEDILITNGHTKRINTELVDCDLYRMLQGDPETISKYEGFYLCRYSWAEETNAQLYKIKENV